MLRKHWLHWNLIVVSAAVITACGGAPAAPAPAATSVPATQAAPTKAAAATSAPASSNLPKVVIYQNTGFLKRPDGSEPARLEEVRQIIRKEVGVDPVAIIPPKGSETEKLNLLLGSPSEPLDVFQGNWPDYADAVIPLNDLLPKYGPDILKAWSKEAWASVTDGKGNIMGIPRTGLIATYPTWVRTDLLKKFNMSSPKTIDEYEAYLKAVKDSDPQAIPLMAALDGLRFGLAGGFTDAGYSHWLDPTDNKIKPAELQPGYKDFVAKMADWYKKGYIYKESFTQYDDLELFKTTKVGAMNSWYSNVTIRFAKVKAEHPELDMAIADGLMGPKGKVQTVNLAGQLAVMITKKAKDPVAVLKLINWEYANLDNNLTAGFGVQGKDWKWTDPNNKYYFDRIDQTYSYAGDFLVSLGVGVESKYAPNDPQLKSHYLYIRDKILDFSVAKLPFDYQIPYDTKAIKNKFPNSGDLNRLLDEETTKFITGARPISEWDTFLKEMNNAGLNDWITAYTEQYNALKK